MLYCVNSAIYFFTPQGLHCSRCLYMEHCPGCEISRDGEAILRPGDHLTVCIQEVAQNQIEHAQRFTDHKSMEKQRSNEPITLLDCFSAFTQRYCFEIHLKVLKIGTLAVIVMS